MRILITGGAGFIGSNFVRYVLRNTRHEVLNLDRLTYAGNLASLSDLEGHPRYAFMEGDIADQDVLKRIFAEFRPEAVVHLAAESHVDRSIDGPAPFIQTNIVGTCTLLEGCRAYLDKAGREPQNHFRFLHVSTDEVFGSLSPDDPPFRETTPYAPRSPYSASKASSDLMVRAWGETYGLPIIITHCSNNYGPYQYPEKLIPTVILRALRGETIPIYGKGENVRDWLFVEDHARALVAVLERGRVGEAYLIGGNAERRNIDLVQALCSLLDECVEQPIAGGYASQIQFVEDRPGHDFRYAIDSRKIQMELGWEPWHDLATGLRMTVQWYLRNHDWWQPLVDQEGSRLIRRGIHSRAVT